jgi:Cys-tRNA(Pro) deacylase
MGRKPKFPTTPAVRALRAAGVAFEGHLYDYVERGGAERSASELGVDLHLVVKTLVLEDDTGAGLLMLMHGDRAVATGVLAKQIGRRKLRMCEAAKARKLTGYEFGGTSPFGTRTPLPVFAERTVLELDSLYIKGGKRGFLVSMPTDALRTVLSPTPVDASM